MLKRKINVAQWTCNKVAVYIEKNEQRDILCKVKSEDHSSV